MLVCAVFVFASRYLIIQIGKRRVCLCVFVLRNLAIQIGKDVSVCVVFVFVSRYLTIQIGKGVFVCVCLCLNRGI